MKQHVIIDKAIFQERIKELVKESNLGKNIPSVNSQLAESLLRFEKEMLKHCYYVTTDFL